MEKQVYQSEWVPFTPGIWHRTSPPMSTSVQTLSSQYWILMGYCKMRILPLMVIPHLAQSALYGESLAQLERSLKPDI